MKENNILLANFLGLEKQEDNTYFDYESGEYINPENLNYNESWDMLMLVVTKIESIDIGNFSKPLLESIGFNAKFILDDGTRVFKDCKGETKIEAVYNACVEFVEWWNKENKV